MRQQLLSYSVNIPKAGKHELTTPNKGICLKCLKLKPMEEGRNLGGTERPTANNQLANGSMSQ